MDKLHKIQLAQILESYREKTAEIETFNWGSREAKIEARFEIMQYNFEQLLVLLSDQEKLLD